MNEKTTLEKMAETLPLGKSATPLNEGGLSGAVIFEMTDKAGSFFIGTLGIKSKRKEKK
jgi:hypothetical protein